jgi:hypothetical protein
MPSARAARLSSPKSQAEGSGLILSGTFYPDLKIRVCLRPELRPRVRRRTYQIFTVVIWGSDRNKFKNPPEVFFKEKRVCVTGQIDTYRGKPEIIVRDPSQVIETH